MLSRECYLQCNKHGKVIAESKYKGICYSTPFRKKPVKLNSIIKNASNIFKGIFTYSITSEGVHALVDYSEFAIRYYSYDCVIVKAIIPKGSLYYVSCDHKEVAANKLYLTDEIAVEL